MIRSFLYFLSGALRTPSRFHACEAGVAVASECRVGYIILLVYRYERWTCRRPAAGCDGTRAGRALAAHADFVASSGACSQDGRWESRTSLYDRVCGTNGSIMLGLFARPNTCTFRPRRELLVDNSALTFVRCATGQLIRIHRIVKHHGHAGWIIRIWDSLADTITKTLSPVRSSFSPPKKKKHGKAGIGTFTCAQRQIFRRERNTNSGF